MLHITTNKQKENYISYLIKEFGTPQLAIKCINEMLDVMPDGSDKIDLKYAKRMIIGNYNLDNQ